MNNYIKNIYKSINFPFIDIEYHTFLPSTNSYLKEIANNRKEGLIIIADGQTAGKGRFNRTFFSPDNSGIYMSILLKPKNKGFNSTFITTAAAVAVAKACEELSGKEAQIKWVNDVLINNKKVCGILTEGCINPKSGIPEYVILGIGINAFTPKNGFDAEIKDIAGSVFCENSLSLKSMLTAKVINYFFEYYLNLEEKRFLTEYKNKSVITGKDVLVYKNNSVVSAKAISIDDEFRLLVEYENGSREFLSSGEVSIKLA